MKNIASLGVTSRYRMTAVKADGTERPLTGWFQNLITSAGLDLYINDVNVSGPFSCRVGTGTAAPSLSDTDLQIPVTPATSGSWQVNTGNRWDIAGRWWGRKARYRFAAGTVNGRNLTEVSMWINSVMFSRALIRDAAGNPAAVSLLADEFLDVEWELFEIFQPASGTFYQFIDGVEVAFSYAADTLAMGEVNWQWGPLSGHNVPFTLAASGGSWGSNAIAAFTGNTLADPTTNIKSGNIGIGTSVLTETYVPGTHRRSYRFSFGLDAANNIAGIGSVRYLDTRRLPFQIAFSPSVMKTSTKIYTLDFEVSVANADIPAGA